LGVGATIGFGAASAQAADYPAGEWGSWNGQSTRWGNILIAGRYGYCVDPGTPAPAALDDASAARICGGLAPDGTPDATAQLAYLLGRYDQTSDNAVAAAVSQLARGQYHAGIPVSQPATRDQLLAEAGRNGGPRAGLLEVDADNLAAWFGLVRAGETNRATAHFADGFTATLTITSPNATFASGDNSISLTTATTARSVELVPRHQLIADEVVSLTMSIQGVPDSCYLLHTQGSSQRVATGLTMTLTAQASDHASQTPWRPRISTVVTPTLIPSDHPTVTDQLTIEAIGNSQWPVQQWADANQTQPKTYFPLVASAEIARANQPPAPSGVLPDLATLVASDPILVSLDHPGTVSTELTLPESAGAGYYALHWCLDAKYQGDYAKYLPPGGPVCDDWFAPTEQFLRPMRLAVSSDLPARFSPTGTAPDDTVTVSLPNPADQWLTTADGHPATIVLDGSYYAGSATTFVIADQPPPDAQVLATASVSVTLPTSGRQPVTVAAPAGFTLPTSQYGVWVWRIDLAHQSEAVARLIAADAADQFGQPSETHVTQMDLTINSSAVDAALAEPPGSATASVCDTVWLELASPDDLWLDQWGTDQPVTVAVSGHVYHAAVPAAQTLIPGNVPSVEDYALTFSAAGRDHAQTVCHTISHGDYGAFGFQYSIDPAAQPTATASYLHHAVTTPLWLPSETTMVSRTPRVDSTATRWNTTTDGKVTTYFQDDIWQSDWPEAPGDTTEFGAVGHGDWPGYGGWAGDGATVTIELWRLTGPVDAQACSPNNPAAQLIASTTTIPARNTWAAAQKVSGSAFRADGPGTYTFVIDWPGDARTQPYRSICGEPSETIVVSEANPDLITQLVLADQAVGSTIASAQQQTTASVVSPGASLVDVLHAWYPTSDTTAMIGWRVSWQAFFIPTSQDPTGSEAADPVACHASTLYWSSPEPVGVDGPGQYASAIVTAPMTPGRLFVVETITETSQSGSPQVVHRGVCGAISETVVVLPPAAPANPGPAISTQAPPDALTGQAIRDQASLTGPFEAGTIIEFWGKPTAYVDPTMPEAHLECVQPAAHDLTGAIRIGQVVLDHSIASGQTETIWSPEFTSQIAGCTHIKEIAWTPPTGGAESTLIVEGWFGQPGETTHWHPPVGPQADTGGQVTPTASPAGALSLGLTGVAILAVAIMVAAGRRRSRTNRR